jgi:hypothetical protein
MDAGSVAESKCDVRFAKADVADEDDVGVAGDKGQTEQVLDLRAVDFFGPAPLEVLERFDRREARIPDASLDCAVLMLGGLALNQLRRNSRCESCCWAALVAKAWYWA